MSEWTKHFSTKRNAYYWFNSETNESKWDERPSSSDAPALESAGTTSVNESDSISLKRNRETAFATTVSDWEERFSEKHQKKYYFNKVTKESKWHLEDTLAGKEISERKMESSETKSDSDTAGASLNVPLTGSLKSKRDYLFRKYSKAQLQMLQMDDVASYSVTESRSADTMSELLFDALRTVKRNRLIVQDTCILDGMACVGGNTINFASYFGQVYANELNTRRYEMLNYNARTVMQLNNVTCFNESILTLALRKNDYDILFLDPEWGGPDYKNKTNLILPISDSPMEEFCLQVFQTIPRVSIIGLKLPVNYDNDYIRQFADKNGLNYAFHTNDMSKMTLTILTRK